MTQTNNKCLQRLRSAAQQLINDPARRGSKARLMAMCHHRQGLSQPCANDFCPPVSTRLPYQRIGLPGMPASTHAEWAALQSAFQDLGLQPWREKGKQKGGRNKGAKVVGPQYVQAV